MRARLVLGLAGLLVGCGGATPPARPAPGRFVLHADAASLHAFKHADDFGFRGAADIGYESTACCGVGLFIAHTSLGDRNPDTAKRVKVILDGGFELGLIVPGTDNRLRLRVRGGKSATPPDPGSAVMGRGGFSAAPAVVLRIWDIEPPAVNQPRGDVDLFLEYAAWSLGEQRTAAGPYGEPWARSALVLGLRVGTDYGVDLE